MDLEGVTGGEPVADTIGSQSRGTHKAQELREGVGGMPSAAIYCYPRGMSA
jgi:hypothetical protein